MSHARGQAHEPYDSDVLDPVPIDERGRALDCLLRGLDCADVALKDVIKPVIDIQAHLAALLRRGPGIATGIVQQNFVAADLKPMAGGITPDRVSGIS